MPTQPASTVGYANATVDGKEKMVQIGNARAAALFLVSFSDGDISSFVGLPNLRSGTTGAHESLFDRA
jgi:hypothetical protein